MNISRSIILGIILFLGMNVQAQEGKLFPALVGETLEGNVIELPKASEGKVTILGMAYSKKAESTLKTWYQPMYDKFVLKLGIFDEFYDVNMYFIPMYTGGKKAAYGPTMKKLKESNRNDLFPYILFYKGEMDPYLETLGMENKNLPYFFVLDEKGTILYAAKGLFSEEKMEKIEEILDSRL